MIVARNLVKNYDDFSLNISMDIPDGYITGLIGKNGAGKSTAIKSILGLIEPDGGSIQVMGKDAKMLTPDDRRKMGVALLDSGFSIYLTPLDVAKILEKLYPAFNKAAFLKECKRHRLPERKQIKDFSTGMKAKLKVLVALSHDAELLIMDEPTAGLDVEARNEILDILRVYLAEKDQRSILITSHIATDLEGLCDDLYLIDEGKVLLHEETDVILSDYGVIKLSEEDFRKLDQEYILACRKEAFGRVCLTNQKQYYLENYPGLVVENCGIDELILLMTGGKCR